MQLTMRFCAAPAAGNTFEILHCAGQHRNFNSLTLEIKRMLCIFILHRQESGGPINQILTYF